MRVMLAMITVGILGVGGFAMAHSKEPEKKACIKKFNDCMKKAAGDHEQAVCSQHLYACMNEAEGHKIRSPHHQ